MRLAVRQPDWGLLASRSQSCKRTQATANEKALARADSCEGFTLGASQIKQISLHRTRYGTGS